MPTKRNKPIEGNEPTKGNKPIEPSELQSPPGSFISNTILFYSMLVLIPWDKSTKRNKPTKVNKFRKYLEIKLIIRDLDLTIDVSNTFLETFKLLACMVDNKTFKLKIKESKLLITCKPIKFELGLVPKLLFDYLFNLRKCLAFYPNYLINQVETSFNFLQHLDSLIFLMITCLLKRSWIE